MQRSAPILLLRPPAPPRPWSFDDLGHLDRLVADLPPSQSAPDVAAAEGYVALRLRQPRHPELAAREALAHALALGGGPPELRFRLAARLVAVEGFWAGNLARTGLLVDALAPLASDEGADPLSVVLWHAGEAAWRLHRGELDLAMARTAHGRKVASRHGARGWEPLFLALEAWVRLARDDVAAAARTLGALATVTAAAPRLARCLYHLVASAVSLHQGATARAAEEGAAGARLAQEAGMPLARAAASVASAVALARGSGGDAELRQALAACGEAGYRYGEVSCLAELADMALRRDEERALELVRSALSGARELGVGHLMWLGSEDLGDLLAFALERDVEAAYARELVRLRGIRPGRRARLLAAWPWPVRVEALDGLTVTVDGGARGAVAKTSKKPMELLRRLVTAGPRGVGRGFLADALWPDADGDRALHALETTIYRLRQALGDRAAIVVRDERVSLDEARVFVDVWARERADRSSIAGERACAPYRAL
jgi:hypothetical protein